MLNYFGSLFSVALNGALAITSSILLVAGIINGLFHLYLPRFESRTKKLAPIIRYYKSRRRYKFILSLVILVSIFMVLLMIGSYDMYTKLRAELAETKLELIVPNLQVKPLDIADNHIALTEMTIDVLNYSDYTAKNIIVDIKFGDSPWRRELSKAVSLRSHEWLLAQKDNELMSHLLSTVGEERLRELEKDLNNRPTWDELKPGKSIKVHMADWSKDYILENPEMFFVPPEESSIYRESQGWRQQIDNIESGKPIPIFLRAVWENEIGKKYDRIIEYQLICTKIDTAISYNFLPTGIVIEDL